MSDHSGSLESWPPYVGGDDDEIDAWTPICACGWRGTKTAYITAAHMELVKHLNSSFAASRTET